MSNATSWILWWNFHQKQMKKNKKKNTSIDQNVCKSHKNKAISNDDVKYDIATRLAFRDQRSQKHRRNCIIGSWMILLTHFTSSLLLYNLNAKLIVWSATPKEHAYHINMVIISTLSHAQKLLVWIMLLVVCLWAFVIHKLMTIFFPLIFAVNAFSLLNTLKYGIQCSFDQTNYRITGQWSLIHEYMHYIVIYIGLFTFKFIFIFFFFWDSLT